MGQQNIIELNGRKYDARSGALLSEGIIKATPQSRGNLGRHQGRVVDGFIRKPSMSKTQAVKPATSSSQSVGQKPSTIPSASQKVAQSAVKKPGIKRTSVSVQPHQPERPKTLMRSVVKKPDVKMKTSIKTTAPSEMAARPASALAKPLEKKLSVTQVNPIRLSHAMHVHKSQHVRRFSLQRNARQQDSTNSTVGGMQVPQPHPASNRPMQYATRLMRQDFRKVSPNINAAVPVTVSSTTTAPKTQKTPNTGDIFEAALARATSHEQRPPARHSSSRRRKSKRALNILAGATAFLFIGGFLAYINLANIEIHVASVQAGFHADLPGYKPTGYALAGSIKSSNGQVAMHYRSGDSGFTITQEPSTWDSATLLGQAVAAQGKPGKTVQRSGRTIYIYNNSNATWVNGGIHYQISGNASLDTDELVSVATSM